MDADSGRHLSKFPRRKVSVSWSADSGRRKADVRYKQASVTRGSFHTRKIRRRLRTIPFGRTKILLDELRKRPLRKEHGIRFAGGSRAFDGRVTSADVSAPSNPSR